LTVNISVKNDNRDLVKKLIIYGLITPLLIVLSGFTVSKYHDEFAQVNFKVRLAQKMSVPENNMENGVMPVEVTTFRSSGVPLENLYKEAASIVRKFYVGSWLMGGFIGLVFGLTLARLTIFRYRNEYLANKGNCYSCARCLEYCPVKKGPGTGDQGQGRPFKWSQTLEG
jgi:hypothetical protein